MKKNKSIERISIIVSIQQCDNEGYKTVGFAKSTIDYMGNMLEINKEKMDDLVGVFCGSVRNAEDSFKDYLKENK